MRVGLRVGLAVVAAAFAVACGISPTGEAAIGDDDGGGDATSGSSSSGGGSGGSGTGSSSGSGSSGGGVQDARADTKNGMDGSKGGGDASVDSSGDSTTSDGPGPDAPPDVPSMDAGCSGPSDCPPGYACEPNGTCDTVCSDTTPCNQGCCDNSSNGRCWPTNNASCQGGSCYACSCGASRDCPQYWACGTGGSCTENCDATHLCNGGCCSDINMGQCVGTDCSMSPEGPVCNNKGFCGCNMPSDCANAGYGPDCNGMPGGAGNGCGCHENGNSGTGDCTGPCFTCDGTPTRCHC